MGGEAGAEAGAGIGSASEGAAENSAAALRAAKAERHPIQGNVSKERILQELAQVLLLPPPVASNETCTAPPVAVPAPGPAGEADAKFCVGRGPGLTGLPRAAPRKIGHMVMFGFEPDTLEILMREEMDVVDFIFIVEAQRTHQKEVSKPLMWEALKRTERFASFVDPKKVVHIVVDEADSTEALKEQKTFKMEKLQTSLGVERIREWAKHTQGLGPDDVFISGDADEVLSRESLNLLRWCNLAEPVVAGALWMPMGALNRAFRTDWPVGGLPRTFAMPTIYEWKVVYASIEDGARHFTKSTGAQGRTWRHYVFGGLHMTGISFLPHALIKELSASSYKGRQEHLDVLAAGEVRDLDLAQIELYNLGGQFKHWKPRTVALNRLQGREQAAAGYVPWFLRCNAARYPYWFGNPDPRNTALLEALHRLQELPMPPPPPLAPPPSTEKAAAVQVSSASAQVGKPETKKATSKAQAAVAAAQKEKGMATGAGKSNIRGGGATIATPSSPSASTPPATGVGILSGTGTPSLPPASGKLPRKAASPNLVQKEPLTPTVSQNSSAVAKAGTQTAAEAAARPASR